MFISWLLWLSFNSWVSLFLKPTTYISHIKINGAEYVRGYRYLFHSIYIETAECLPITFSFLVAFVFAHFASVKCDDRYIVPTASKISIHRHHIYILKCHDNVLLSRVYSVIRHGHSSVWSCWFECPVLYRCCIHRQGQPRKFYHRLIILHSMQQTSCLV